MAEIIDLESVRAKGGVVGDATHNGQDGWILAGGLQLVIASMREAFDDSLRLMFILVALINKYGDRSALCEDLPEDLRLEIGEAFRFVKDVRLVSLRKSIPDLEGLLEWFTTGRKPQTSHHN